MQWYKSHQTTGYQCTDSAGVAIDLWHVQLSSDEINPPTRQQLVHAQQNYKSLSTYLLG